MNEQLKAIADEIKTNLCHCHDGSGGSVDCPNSSACKDCHACQVIIKLEAQASLAVTQEDRSCPNCGRIDHNGLYLSETNIRHCGCYYSGNIDSTSPSDDSARLQNDAFEMLRHVLARLDLEAEEKGEGSVFPCAALREPIRKLLLRKFGASHAPGTAIIAEFAQIVREQNHNLNSTATQEERSEFIRRIIELYNYKVIEFMTGKKINDVREIRNES